jgi:hypothetical protein
MPLFDDYETSPEAETSGVVVQFTDFWFKCARAGGANKQYAKVMERKMRPYRHLQENGKMDEAAARGVLKEVYAETIVKDWGGPGLVDKEGQPLGPCTPASVLALLQNPKLESVFDGIYDVVTKSQRYLVTELEADAGN